MNSKMGELVMALFLLLFSLTIISASFLYAAETRIVPLSVGGGTFILLLAVIANEIRPIVYPAKN